MARTMARDRGVWGHSTPTFVTGGVIHIEDAGWVVQGGGPLHPGDGASQPVDLLLHTRVVSHHL